MRATRTSSLFLFFLIGAFAFVSAQSQAIKEAVDLGSKTAKHGFKNEDEIRDKFNNWRSDVDAKNWLASMNYRIGEIESVIASKPHGEKADVEVQVKTRSGEKTEGISIKLVSSPTGFNQIDKRWLSHYVKMWKIGADTEYALKLFVGEIPPVRLGRDPRRMYLNELDQTSQVAVVDFFTMHKEEIVSDLFQGNGVHAAGWVMVAFKATANTRWAIRTSADTIKFFGDGKVEITRAGNLKIGRVTMQRKGGDGGRETAKMLQFKINPVQLFDLK